MVTLFLKKSRNESDLIHFSKSEINFMTSVFIPLGCKPKMEKSPLHVLHVKCLNFVYLKRGFWLHSLFSAEVSDLNLQGPNTFEMNLFSFKYYGIVEPNLWCVQEQSDLRKWESSLSEIYRLLFVIYDS